VPRWRRSRTTMSRFVGGVPRRHWRACRSDRPAPRSCGRSPGVRRRRVAGRPSPLDHRARDPGCLALWIARVATGALEDMGWPCGDGGARRGSRVSDAAARVRRRCSEAGRDPPGRTFPAKSHVSRETLPECLTWAVRQGSMKPLHPAYSRRR